MAYYNQALAFFLIALLLFTSANPLAHGLGLTVGGQLCCTSTGNCPGQGVDGALISLNCTNILGHTTTVGQTTTNANGTFNITVPALEGIIFGLTIIPCTVGFNLPLDSVVCPVLNTTNGVLSSPLLSVGTLVTSLFGLVQNAILVRFVRLSGL